MEGLKTIMDNRDTREFASIDANESQEGLRGAAEQVKQTAQDAAGTAKEQVGSVVSQVKEQATSRIEAQKERATSGIDSVATAIRQTGDQLRDGNQDAVAGYVDQAARRLESFSAYLRNRDVNEIIEDVETIARREPTIFMAGAFFLGLLGARFLKSSRPRQMGNDYNERSSYAMVPYEGRENRGYSGRSSFGENYDAYRGASYGQTGAYRSGSGSYGTGAGSFGTGSGTTGTGGTDYGTRRTFGTGGSMGGGMGASTGTGTGSSTTGATWSGASAQNPGTTRGENATIGNEGQDRPHFVPGPRTEGTFGTGTGEGTSTSTSQNSEES